MKCTGCGGDQFVTLKEIRNWDNPICHCVPIHEEKLISCPFCEDTDFDKIGLKNHLLNGHCAPFDSTARVNHVR